MINQKHRKLTTKKNKSFLIAIFSMALLTPIAAFADNIYQTYYHQASKLYSQMSLDEKIGQLLMPSYVLLAQSVSPNGVQCSKAVQNSQTPANIVIRACGLNQIATYHLGAVLTGGGPYYNEPSLDNWRTLNSLAVREHGLSNSLDPLLLTGNDAVHGNMHVQGAVIFPHNIGLGVTHDPELVKKIGQLVGEDSLASGFNWVFAPTLAVAQDLRWGRTYESFGEDPALVKTMAQAYIEGFQNIQNSSNDGTQKITGVLATAKHFIGDGATKFGLDEGDDAYTGSETQFWQENGQGYEGALSAEVGSMMISYSAINGDNTRMHFGGQWDIVNKIKNTGIIGTDGKKYQFAGFTVSDWNGATRAAYFYQQKNKIHLTLSEILAKSFNSGIDMFMLGQDDNVDPFDPHSPQNFTNVGQVFNALKTAYNNKLISEKRLKDAVTRILAVKLAMEVPFKKNYQQIQTQERQLALQAAEESLVLLKNSGNTLPIKTNNIKNVIFLGDTNDLGVQNGGWTVNWQGQKGSEYFKDKNQISSGAMTLEEGIKMYLQHQSVNYYKASNIPSSIEPSNTIAFVVIAEAPYAEFMGDIANTLDKNNPWFDKWYYLGAANQYNNYLTNPQSLFLGLTFEKNDAEIIKFLRRKHVKVITVVYSGRPVALTQGGDAAPFQHSNVMIAAFLPGTLGGQALAAAIFGDYHFNAKKDSNTLTFPWPKNMDDISQHFSKGWLFPLGFGLKD